jgi:hypothetical protein
MNPSHKLMNDFIRGRAGRVIAEQPQVPQIANANAGNATGGRIPTAPPKMNDIIRLLADRRRYTGKG